MFNKFFAGSIAMLMTVSPVLAVELPGPLVSTEWLAEHQDDVLVVDVRNDDTSYIESGHILGAIPLDFRRARGLQTEDGIELDSMNLSAADFTALMQSVGLDTGEPIVLTHRGRGADDVGYAAYVYGCGAFGTASCHDLLQLGPCLGDLLVRAQGVARLPECHAV